MQPFGIPPQMTPSPMQAMPQGMQPQGMPPFGVPPPQMTPSPMSPAGMPGRPSFAPQGFASPPGYAPSPGYGTNPSFVPQPPPGYGPPGTMPPGVMAGVNANPQPSPGWNPSVPPQQLQPSGIAMNRPSFGPPGMQGNLHNGPGSGSYPPHPAASRSSLPPGAGRGSLPPNAVQTPTIGGKPSMPPQPVQVVPRAQIREVSSVTNFQKDAGDSSRSVLFIGIAVLVIVFGIFAFPKDPPPVVEEAPVRHALPKELVKEALSGHKAAELPGAADEPPPVPTPTPSPGETAPASPVASAEATPVPAEPKTGNLSLTTDPAVDVYVGSKLVGRTPLRVELPTGVHKLRFTDATKMINLYKSYRVRGGADTADTLSFGTSQLKVVAPDGSSISLNGREIGVAPLEPKTIFEGKYMLKVIYEGKSWSQAFDAPAGRTIDYQVRFE